MAVAIRNTWAGGTGVAISLALHALIATSLFVFRPSPRPVRTSEPIELEVASIPTPPPPIPVAPEPPPPPPPPVRSPRLKPAPPPPTEAPPPPSNAEPPPSPSPEPPTPVVGLTADSVVQGPADIAVPVGNTLMAAPTAAPPKPVVAPAPYIGGTPGGTGEAPFAPVSESYVRTWPTLVEEVQAPYPEEAILMEIEGTVRLSLGIDREGSCAKSRFLRKLGHGLDEAAVNAVRKFRWKPALGNDGKAVAFRIQYNYTFRLPR